MFEVCDRYTLTGLSPSQGASKTIVSVRVTALISGTSYMRQAAHGVGHMIIASAQFQRL